jgi:hypothetical protein
VIQYRSCYVLSKFFWISKKSQRSLTVKMIGSVSAKIGAAELFGTAVTGYHRGIPEVFRGS